MSQLSRPYQIALLAMVLLAAVWFVALRGSSAGTSTGGAGSSVAASSPAPAPASQAQAAAAPTHVYHGSAPGVEGLTRAIDKAHGAVATSQRNAKQLEEKSAQASDSASSGSAATAKPTQAAASQGAAARHAAAGKAQTAKPTTSATSGAGAARGTHRTSLTIQERVEGELKRGKVVAILFWNPKASVDQAVQRELQAAGHALAGKLAVHDAQASQVGSFGSITRTIQVDQTPTILIVNKHGQTTTLNGLTDVFSIKQAVSEAQH
jgi:hypothetical protein